MIDPAWKTIFSKKILGRGKDYYNGGAVFNLEYDGRTLRAEVEGRDIYEVEVELKDHLPVSSSCTCPYSADVGPCKHMAAVLFAAEAEGITDQEADSGIVEPADGLAGILQKLSKEQLLHILLDITKTHGDIALDLEAQLKTQLQAGVLKQLENEVDKIFRRFQRYGRINYYDANPFEDAINLFLYKKVEKLIDTHHYWEAFRICLYIVTTLNHTVIDDDGQIVNLCENCYGYWEAIIEACSPEDKEAINSIVRKTIAEKALTDYPGDILQEFLEQELATNEELRARMKELDQQIEAAGTSTECPEITTFRGEDIPVVILRLELMDRLQIPQEEKDTYLLEHRHFKVIREVLLEKARQADDKMAQIALLEESRQIDQLGKYERLSILEDLATLYKETNQPKKELDARVEAVQYDSYSVLDAFTRVKAMATSEQWPTYRARILATVKDKATLCQLLAKDGDVETLYGLLFSDPDINAIDKYRKILSKSHGQDLLNYYGHYVDSLVQEARHPTVYKVLVYYLQVMQQYKGGKELVRTLASNWRKTYPTRKLLIKMLEEF